MWPVIISRIVRRPGRAVALLVGVALAVSSFAVLTGASERSRLEVVGTVEGNFRSAYDVLVRPGGSRLPLEAVEGVVRPNFLSDHFGGITLDQVARIREVPGVGVAAPIAMVGYGVAGNRAAVHLGDDVPSDRRSVFRLAATRAVDGGLTRISLADGYTYFTPNEIAFGPDLGRPEPFVEKVGDDSVGVCLEGGLPASPYVAEVSLTCQSLTSQWGTRVSDPGTVYVPWQTLFLVAAVDPVAEAALVGVDDAVVSGDYLPSRWEVTSTDDVVRDVPVLYSSVPTADVEVELAVEILPEGVAEQVPDAPLNFSVTDGLAATPGEVVWSETVTAADAHKDLAAALTASSGAGLNSWQGQVVSAYWTAGPVELVQGSDGTLTPRPTRVAESVFALGGQGREAFIAVPPETGDVAFRRLTRHGGSSQFRQGEYQVALRAVGSFDPTMLDGFSELSRVPLTTYAAPRLHCADDDSCALLGDRDLLPSGSPAGYLQQPPLMLTILDALPAFYNGYYRDSDAAAAPISAVRVRVEGVTGLDDLSRERVRLVAEQIATETGLDVDVTMGSSPSPQAVDLPAGDHGRPQLKLRELWTSKGVATVIAAAVDRKSLVLFVLVLVVCGLFVGNAAAASVRARRSELGVLAALGWTRRVMFSTVLAELVVIGLLAGALGMVAAWLAGSRLELVVSWQRAMLAVPAALMLTMVAGIVPAWLASRLAPMAALRPPVSTGARARLRLGVLGLAAANLRRQPGRTLVGGAALAAGTGAFTMLLAVTSQFHGSLVGTLLGEAVAVQVRGIDFAAVVAMLVLAGIAIADVLYLNVRDRIGEFAVLRATGWTETGLARLVATEGLMLGALGAMVGTAIGMAGAGWFAGGAEEIARLVPVGAATIAAGLALATLALIAPLVALRRRSTVELLAQE